MYVWHDSFILSNVMTVMRLLVLPVSMFLPRVLRLCDMTQILVMSNGGFYAIVRTEFYVTSSDPPHVNFFWCESVMSVWHDSDPSMSQFVTVFYVTSSDPPYVNLFEMSPSCLCDMSQILLCHSSWPYSMSRRQILPMSICLRWVRHVCVTWLRSSCVIVRDCILCHVVRSSPCQFVWDESVMSVWHDSDPPHVKWRILCHSSWPYSMSRRQILPMSICLRWVRHVCVTWLRSSYVIVRDCILCHVVWPSIWHEEDLSCQVWHESFVCVTWLIFTCEMTHSCSWHDSSYMTHLIWVCYGVATISRLLKIIGLFCKRAL